ncbi:hypothetical protein IAI18_02815 [Acetobacteraceae bacterium H6797]|nr:hypothetical protein [Acetobacteraceae bacterium H6797]
MISANSLAAFTASAATEIARSGPAAKPSQPSAAETGATPVSAAPADSQRKLESVPALPSTPLPRGSLLDLRV